MVIKSSNGKKIFHYRQLTEHDCLERYLNRFSLPSYRVKDLKLVYYERSIFRSVHEKLCAVMYLSCSWFYFRIFGQNSDFENKI